jgi:hypothetical protein
MSSELGKSNDLKWISRVDIPKKDNRGGTHGWQVRILRKSLNIQQFFNDNKYSTKEDALEAAKTYRDAISKEHNLTWNDQGYSYKTSRNSSGFIGVHRAKSVSRKSYGEYPQEFWQAHWPTLEGKTKTKKFSVTKYGEEEALRLAIKARKTGIENYKRRKHLIFQTPTNPDIKIWRYMDFTKFVSMLEHQGLFFPRADFLGDPFEGSFSKINRRLRPLVYKTKPEDIDIDYISNFIQKLRKHILVSCWHMNELESAAMWKLYAKTDEAICIQSTYTKLNDSLVDIATLGEVNYVDYNKEWVPESHPIYPFLHKRKSFEHEREIRAIINLENVTSFDEFKPTKKPPEFGKWAEVPLNELIEKIYVAPQTQNWFFDLVNKVSKKYSLEVSVNKSRLEESPIY